MFEKTSLDPHNDGIIHNEANSISWILLFVFEEGLILY